MQTLSINANIDIRAPRDEVWALIADLDKRVRLCPLWDVLKTEALTPSMGLESRFRLRTRRQNHEFNHEICIVELVPGRRLTTARDNSQIARTTWGVQDCAAGTRLMYEEIFEIDDAQSAETILPLARQAAHQWLASLKLYLEWRYGRITRAWRWLFDRFLLHMPTSQRRVVMGILLLHIASAISFIAAALVWGFALRQ